MVHRTPSRDEVSTDFDRIARAVRAVSPPPGPSSAERALVAELPRGLVLDVGCGFGRFTPALAQHAERVIGIDASREMIELARERNAHLTNVSFVHADLMDADLPLADGIVCVDTVHHLPLAPAFARFAALLRPGGRLRCVDLHTMRTPLEAALGAYTIARRFFDGAPLVSAQPAVREAYDAHDEHETYPTLREVRDACRATLPGAEVRPVVGFRYRLRWDRDRA
jgi:SAM-dependent methyltransferase